MNYLGDNNNYDDDRYWDVIEVSKINDKIIRRLINYLKTGISDNFYISFESVLKLNKKIPIYDIQQAINIFKSTDYRKQLFQFIFDFITGKTIQYHLLPQLYNPDFIIRAKAVMKIRDNNDNKYLKFLIPMIDDPDDSVRWSVINYLVEYKKIPEITLILKNHLLDESNPIIYKNLKSIL